MAINMYGCDQYGYAGARLECINPSASPLGATLFFTPFVQVGGLIVLNFAIGVVINSMGEDERKSGEHHCPAQQNG